MIPFLVHHFLSEAAQRSPDHPFLIQDGVCATYAEIEEGSNRIAQTLRREGGMRGERVGILAHNSPLYVEAYYGTLKAGGVTVPLNTASDGPTLRGMLADCGARVLIAGPRFERQVASAIGTLPDLATLICPDPTRIDPLPAAIRGVPLREIEGEPADDPSVPQIDLDLASIIYTSGSTGRPRGAMLSHLNLVANARSIVSYLGLTPEDRVLAVLPFYYVYGKSLLNTHAVAGGTVVIENRFLYPNRALDTMEREACTGLSGVPSTFAILLNRSNFAERELRHLRYVTQAGGSMSPELTRRLMAALPRKKIFIMYGATEAGARLSYLDPADLPRKVGSIGRAIPNVELRILAEDGSECAVGGTGEIVARGSNLMSGYWDDPDESREVLDRTGYRTGDLGRRDDEGFLYVVGRKKEMIKAGAHRISPMEIEEAILEFPEVEETAVIGLPDEILDEAIKAFVVFRHGSSATVEELEAFLDRRLPAYKVPTLYENRSSLPKNEAGKIMKQALRTEPQ